MNNDLTHAEHAIVADFADKHCPPGLRVVVSGVVIEYMRSLKRGEKPAESAKTLLREGYHVISQNPRTREMRHPGDDSAEITEKVALDRTFAAFVNSPGSYSKGTCKGQFAGSERLFEACWRELLRCRRHTEIDTQADAGRWLDLFAAEKVNNPKSAFYLWG
jgi:hypothetical protein